jgi:glycerophosphoryl diester phosphodiesterase
MPDLQIPRIIAHRGAKASAPENTLASIRRAYEEGARWVEFDVKLTADGHPILIHDETLDRTTDGRGPVREHTLAEIRKLDAGAWFGGAFAGERVPTLAEALDLLATLGMGFNLEVKPCPGRERETASVALKMVRQRWPETASTPVISSFAPESLRAARDVAPELPRGYLFDALPSDWVAQAEALGCRTVHPGVKHLTQAQVGMAKAAGYPLLVWTVNDPAQAATIVAWGVDSVITDAPARVAVGLERSAEA